MDKLNGKQTNRDKKKKEANHLNTKLSTTQKYIIAIILGTLFALYEIGQKEAKNMNARSAWIGR